jgi:hypothetical protein
MEKTYGNMAAIFNLRGIRRHPVSLELATQLIRVYGMNKHNSS